MPVYSDKFLLTQIGRSIAIHYDSPQGSRRQAIVKHGTFMGVKEVGMLGVRVHGEEYPLRVEQDADQPAFAARGQYGESTWWEWTSPQRPLPRDFKDE